MSVISDIKTGNNIRVITMRNRPVAFQASYAMRWKIGMANCDAWIDCPTCDLSIGARDETGATISDAEFVAIANVAGWVVIPGKRIACPECLEKERIDE